MTWPESWKQSLRHLAAARFYLPVTLKGDDEDMYLDYLHNREYKLALEELEAFGIENRGFAQEALFWRELELAAASMGLADEAKEYAQRAKDAAGS
ncbi:MAG TPA: hypothetical protein VGI57_05315 [Usitatibacter sp.]